MPEVTMVAALNAALRDALRAIPRAELRALRSAAARIRRFHLRQRASSWTYVEKAPVDGEVKILTSCPACLGGVSRYSDDAGTTADYIVVEIAKHLLGENWMRFLGESLQPSP